MQRESDRFKVTFTIVIVIAAPTCAPFYQAEKIPARINSSFAYEDR